MHIPPTSNAGACASIVAGVDEDTAFVVVVVVVVVVFPTSSRRDTSATYGDLMVALGRLMSVPRRSFPKSSRGGMFSWDDDDDGLSFFLRFVNVDGASSSSSFTAARWPECSGSCVVDDVDVDVGRE